MQAKFQHTHMTPIFSHYLLSVGEYLYRQGFSTPLLKSLLVEEL